MKIEKLVLIDAIYINNSGGKVLLDYLLKYIIENNLSENFLFLIDYRFKNDNLSEVNYLKGESSEFFRYEYYKKNKNEFLNVFCFGNVPPPIKINCNVFLYFHNVLLAELLSKYPFKERLLKTIKRLYIKLNINKISKVYVQTEYVKKKFRKKINKKIDIEKLPFFDLSAINFFEREFSNPKFLYLSNGNFHKNHDILFDVWEMLAEENFFPELNLTITDDHISKIERISEMRKKKINIINHGYVDVNLLFSKTTHLIYPSLKESFGLGLVEAVKSGMKVVAADLPYTYEVISPSLTFNPNDRNDLYKKVISIIQNKQKIKESSIIIEDKIQYLIGELLNK